ncbi:MAG: hypothetical protein K5924_09985 [Chloroflexi bacterium]|nr:hypothetical protein [Chloroflexota bacterium]
MSDVHDRFDAWLDSAGQPELARDVAMHASGCDRCLRQAIAIDGLLTIDVGHAPAPPVLDPGAIGTFTTSSRSQMRLGAWALAVSVVVAAGVMGITNLPGLIAEPTTALDPPAPTAEGILGGGPEPSTLPGSASAVSSESARPPRPSPTESPTASPSPTEAERPEVATVTPRTAAPTIDSTVGPIPTTPVPTPRPTITAPATPSPTPSSPSPTPPTPSPTPPPTPSPSPTPEPTPSPQPSEP